MYRVIVKYPVCAYVVTYYNVQSIKTPLHSEFWCGAASHYYTTRQSPSHYLTSGQIIRWLVMIGHQMLILSACLLSVTWWSFLIFFWKDHFQNNMYLYSTISWNWYNTQYPSQSFFVLPLQSIFTDRILETYFLSYLWTTYMDFKKAFVEWSNYNRTNSNFYIHIMSPERSSSL